MKAILFISSLILCACVLNACGGKTPTEEAEGWYPQNVDCQSYCDVRGCTIRHCKGASDVIIRTLIDE